MEQQVAELLAEVGIIGSLDGINHLVAFLDEERAEAGVGLFYVPWAPIGRTEPSDNYLKAGDAV
jgi:hypothetical protein